MTPTHDQRVRACAREIVERFRLLGAIHTERLDLARDAEHVIEKFRAQTRREALDEAAKLTYTSVSLAAAAVAIRALKDGETIP